MQLIFLSRRYPAKFPAKFPAKSPANSRQMKGKQRKTQPIKQLHNFPSHTHISLRLISLFCLHSPSPLFFFLPGYPIIFIFFCMESAHLAGTGTGTAAHLAIVRQSRQDQDGESGSPSRVDSAPTSPSPHMPIPATPPPSGLSPCFYRANLCAQHLHKTNLIACVRVGQQCSGSAYITGRHPEQARPDQTPAQRPEQSPSSGLSDSMITPDLFALDPPTDPLTVSLHGSLPWLANPFPLPSNPPRVFAKMD